MSKIVVVSLEFFCDLLIRDTRDILCNTFIVLLALLYYYEHIFNVYKVRCVTEDCELN